MTALLILGLGLATVAATYFIRARAYRRRRAALLERLFRSL